MKSVACFLFWGISVGSLFAQTPTATPTATATATPIAAPTATPKPTPTPLTITCVAANASSEIDWSKWVANLIALVNLIAVATLFIWAINDRQERANREIFTFWSQTLIITPSKDKLIKFFDRTVSDLQAIEGQEVPQDGAWEEARKDRMQKWTAFKSDLNSIRNELVEPLTWLHSKFGVLTTILNDLEEAVSDTLEAYAGIAGKIPPGSAAVISIKRRFYEALWDAQKLATTPGQLSKKTGSE